MKWAAMNSACSTLTQKPSARTELEIGQRAQVVAAAAPADVAEIRAIGEAVVVEGGQELALEGMPEAQLGGDVAVEVGQERAAVLALRGGGEPDELVGAETRDEGLVGAGRNVVTLVDDHVAKVGGAEAIEELDRALDAREDVFVAAGRFATDQELSEGAVAQGVAERVARALEDLPAMGEEE